MISKVEGDFPGNPGTITIYNSADHAIDLDGIKLMKNYDPQVKCADLPSASLAAGGTTTATCSELNAAAIVYLADVDGDNNGDEEGSAINKIYIIDAVCWNAGAGSHGSCNDATDPPIAAGVWAEDTYVNNANDQGIRLVTNGDNDDGVSDWEAIPEFGTF